MTQTTHIPVLKIPSDTENSSAFTQRLAALIRDQDTHIYIDTSFLMWMTKIGSDSRQELVDWLQKNCAGRVHVPIWAAHEYLKHYVAETIKRDLDEKIGKVRGMVKSAYTDLRPFIDEPLGEGGEDPSTIRAQTRRALNMLGLSASKIGLWRKSYQKHASEVISFINEVTPEQTSVYDHLENITQAGVGRFMASVPPGYKDRRKKGRGQQFQESKDEAPAGSNQYGDLVFWKEVLVHAKHVEAEALVVVTNDRKNDWHMGRSDKTKIDSALRSLKKDWDPIPRPHPMLVMEAKLVAEVGQVELLDSAYLGVLLREVAEDEVRAFTDVAIIPDSPEPDEETAEASTVADGQRYMFPDSPMVQDSRHGFRDALLESRKATDERDEVLLEGWRASAGANRPLSETLTLEMPDGLDHKKLARLARELHDRVLKQISGYEEALVDLVSTLDRLPPNTAAALYLGLLSSMYLVRESNTPRFPPSSLVSQLLFDQQSAPYARNGVYVVAERLADNKTTPLYLPNSERPRVAITLDTEPHTPVTNQLASLRVGEVELLSLAQQDKSLRLSVLFDSAKPTDGEAIIRKACDLFVIPLAQVEYQNLFKQGYTLTETIGFKRPGDIRIPKELHDGE